MRLLDCRLQNVRLHADLPLTFSPRLTLIGGANETGKSTLVEALHRALFLKATATGAPVSALQSRLHLGHPTVELRFEARGDTWTLRKRFSGAGGQVSLVGEASPQPRTGAVAEELLAGLLGVEEPVGGRQAQSILPSRWAHLWVMQGNAGANLLAAGKSHYDFDQLRQQLERSGGAAVQQSALDQVVQTRIEAALEENFTKNGVRKHSPLWQRSHELATAQQATDQALARLADYEQANEDLAAILQELEQAQQSELPALQVQRQRISQGAEVAARLEAAIELARRGLEPIRLRHDSVSKALQELDGLTAEIQERQRALAALAQGQAEAAAGEQRLTGALQERRDSRGRLQTQRQTLEQRGQLLALLGEAARCRDALSRLAIELDRQRQLARRRQELQQQLASVPAISQRDLAQLRELIQRQRDAHTRMEAMAAGVTLLRADQEVRLNGEPLQRGEERLLTSAFSLQVGDGVELEIRPGGGQALDQLEAQVRAGDSAVQQALASLGVNGLEQAEQRLDLRTQLDQQLAGLTPAGQPQAPDPSVLEQQQQRQQERLSQLETQLQDLAAIRQELEREQPLPGDSEGLQALQQTLARTQHHSSQALAQAEADLESAQQALQTVQRQQIETTAALQIQQEQLQDRQQRLEALIGNQGSRETLAERLTALTAERDQAQAELQRLEREHAELVGQDPKQELARLDERIQALNGRIEQLFDQRGAAKQRCDAISAADPYAALERASVQLEAARTDQASLSRLTQAQQLLQELFLEAQADLSSRYSEPLAQAIGSYLRPLVPDGPVVQLAYDATTGFNGLELRRGQDFYPFDQLSGGMREQLAAALRLSMADVLCQGHDGCLPLVFDDAFTNSDPERVRLVKRMLTTAVERGLQVILLTCDPAAYGDFAETVIELGQR